MANLTTWAKRREKDLNPQSCYGSPDFKSGPVPLWHRGKTQSTGVEPVSRRNDRLLSGEFQYHYGTIAKMGGVGLEPTMHKRLIYSQLRYQFRASTQNPSFLFCVRRMNQHDCGEMDLNHQLWRMKPASYLCSIPQWVWWDLNPTTYRLKADYSTN